MSRTRTQTATTLVLSEAPERQRLRAVRAALDERRDCIAELDLEIETLRDRLANFEASTGARLALEHDALRRIDTLASHVERWAELLAHESRARIGERGRRLEKRRKKNLRDRPARRAGATPEPAPEEPVEEAREEPSDRLKSAYRALARRFHPDLARTEEERLHHGQMMAKINLLYRQGELVRLEALAEQARGGELDGELEVDEQLDVLEERLTWFDAVLENLNEERAELEASPTCELWRNVEQGAAVGRDVIGELEAELRDRVRRAYDDIADAVHILEAEVQRYNRDQTGSALARPKKGGALERVFDPFANKRLIRLSLDTIATSRVSRAARDLARWIEAEGPDRPELLRLLLFCYISDLSPFPLEGLESYDDLALRFEILSRGDPQPVPLTEALVAADDLVEYGVRRASERVARTGLVFVNAAARDAVPVALRALPVRRELKRILMVLGEHVTCPSCGDPAFAVPLYRTRGLDDLRAKACPQCGHTLSSYWMPRGKDVQAVLNPAYVDLDLLTEYSFRLARTSVATQLLPVQVDNRTVGDLKRLLFRDLFDRYRLGIKRKQVRLHQGRKAVAERTPLANLDSNQFVVRFIDAPMSVADALEMLRHRIRTRFQPD